MTTTITAEEFHQIRAYIEAQCGIALGDEKAYLIETRLAKLMTENGCETFSEFYALLKGDVRAVLREKIVDAMTTNETLWFRDTHPFAILREKLLPQLAEKFRTGGRTRFRIWSAACSTGQEPYSISMTIHEFCRMQTTLKPEHFEILATDISPSALFIAMAGRYDRLAINRGLPEEFRDRYFTQQGPVWVLDEAVKKLVTFKKFNLQDSPDAFGPFDIAFLRYVAIYFSDDFKKRIFANLARLLSPSGCLVIGAVESLRGLCEAFELCDHAGGAYYRCSV
jgi:chemotaxis protein methyltransferase CheR